MGVDEKQHYQVMAAASGTTTITPRITEHKMDPVHKIMKRKEKKEKKRRKKLTVKKIDNVKLSSGCLNSYR